jgi:hypothetical protein
MGYQSFGKRAFFLGRNCTAAYAGEVGTGTTLAAKQSVVVEMFFDKGEPGQCASGLGRWGRIHLDFLWLLKLVIHKWFGLRILRQVFANLEFTGKFCVKY